MLLDNNDKRVNRNSHQEQYKSWCSRISDADLQVMKQAIKDFCDDHNEFRSSFMPGQDARIQELFPALTAACRGEKEQAGFFFGNIVWRVVDDRTDEWYFRVSDKDDERPLGTFYWRKNRQ